MSGSDDAIWHDREIRFDLNPVLLKPRRGEFVIDTLDSVEDTKGNNGERGSLTVTNLRMVWTCQKNSRVNLSIGYHAIISITIHAVHSRLRGNTQALYVLTKFNGSRFEFIFTNLVRNSPRLFTTVQAVHKAYESTRLYRDLKLRGAIVRDKELILLPQEQVYSRFGGVWNLSSEQGNLGTMIVSNIRVVWFANLAENFNVSIPYPQIQSINVRDSKFGMALVIETSQSSGAYVLGFRVDPGDRLEPVAKEIQSLHKLFAPNPIFGVEFSVEEKAPELEQLKVAPAVDQVQIVGNEDLELVKGGTVGDFAYSVYFADAASKDRDREVEFSPELGLAVEKWHEDQTTATATATATATGSHASSSRGGSGGTIPSIDKLWRAI